jgi:hypothetical protein
MAKKSGNQESESKPTSNDDWSKLVRCRSERSRASYYGSGNGGPKRFRTESGLDFPGDCRCWDLRSGEHTFIGCTISKNGSAPPVVNVPDGSLRLLVSGGEMVRPNREAHNAILRRQKREVVQKRLNQIQKQLADENARHRKAREKLQDAVSALEQELQGLSDSSCESFRPA